VARLITQGLSNREVGKALAISERTVDAHVQHILNKLGFNSRTQVAAWVAVARTQATTSSPAVR
jgi:DNA-binding NarL/FixJ family response regulator